MQNKSVRCNVSDDATVKRVCDDKTCLSCSNSFSEECPDGDVLHCMCRNGVVVPDNGYCAEYN